LCHFNEFRTNLGLADFTLQARDIDAGVDTTLSTNVPQLNAKAIQANRTLQSVIAQGQDRTKAAQVPQFNTRGILSNSRIKIRNITLGADTTASHVAPVIAPKAIATNRAVPQATIAPGQNTMTATVAPVIAPKTIATNRAVPQVVIAPGQNTTTATAVPVIAPKTIATNRTVPQVVIAPGQNTTTATATPVVAPKTIATNTTNSITAIVTSTGASNTQEDKVRPVKLSPIVKIPEQRKTSAIQQSIVKIAAEHYVKNVGSYAIDSIDTITGIIASRLDNLFKPFAIAVAAGDNFNIVEKGVWLKIFGSKTIQDGFQQNARFENKQQGFVLGADIDFKGHFTTGFAFSINDSNTDFFSNINNYQESKLYSGTVYGEFSMWDNFAINTQLKYGHSFIKHSILTDSPIRGKTRAGIFGASLEGVYKILSKKTQITPLARIAYTSYDIYKFTESDKEGNVKIQIPNKKASMLSTFGSLSFKRSLPFKTLQIEPEFHFGIERITALSHSTDVISIITENVELVDAKFVHPAKTRYNFGGNLYLISRRGLRVGFGGDYMYGKNFQSQAMFANLLLNF